MRGREEGRAPAALHRALGRCRVLDSGTVPAECDPVLKQNRVLPFKRFSVLLSSLFFFFFPFKHAESGELILEASLVQGCFWQAQGC